MPNTILLTGPPAAGKNSVAYHLAFMREKCAVIDTDDIRWMLRQPHIHPWEDGAHVVLEFAIKQATMLAHSFLSEGYDTVILDVINPTTLALYQSLLPLKTVALTPSLTELEARLKGRGDTELSDRQRELHERYQTLNLFDLKIDNSEIPPEELAQRINAWMDTL